MSKEMRFGRSAGLSHRTRYGPGTNEAEITAAIDEVRRFAEAGGIHLGVERNGHEVVYRFDNYADYLIINQGFNQDVSGDSPLTDFTAVHRFENRGQAYIDTWAYLARDYLDKTGVGYRVDEAPDALVFHFKTFEGYTTFQAFRDAGYFDRRAEARIAHAGPVPPGSLPY